MIFSNLAYPLLERHANKIFSEAQILLQCRRMYSKRSHYDVLNLTKNCSNDDIRQSFAKLSKMYHPDTCKTGNSEQNARKFQEIMEAYRVLSKQSSRAAYDMNISVAQPNQPNYAYNPYHYYATTQRRERRFYEGDFASWQQHMHNQNQYYRTGQNYDAWAPHNVFNKKRVYGFIFCFVMSNLLTVYIVYSLSKRNLIRQDFEARRLLRDAARHGYNGHVPHYIRDKPKQNEE